jgi:hypothetical protein
MKIGSIENKPAVTSVSNDRKSAGTTAAGKGASESSATVAHVARSLGPVRGGR